MAVAPRSAAISPVASRTQREFTRECVEFFAEVVQLFGVPKSAGQIYGVLYASPAPLSFSDIVEQLVISKGSASQGLQLLRSVGAIRLAHNITRSSGFHPMTPGIDVSRRDYFEPELSLRKLMSGILQERITPLAATGGDRLARLGELAKREGIGSDFYLIRVKQLETWRRRSKAVLPVLSALLGPKSGNA